MASIEAIYSGSGAIPYFAGSRRQFGGGIFGSLARFVLPAVKNIILPNATRALQTLGKSAVNVGKNVAMDVLQGRNVKEAFADHTKKEALNQLEKHFQPNKRKRKAPPPKVKQKRAKKYFNN